MALIIKGGKRLFPSKKKNRQPITTEILEKITLEESLTVTDLNIDIAFRVAWAGFMRLREITYTATEAKTLPLKKLQLQDQISHLQKQTNTPSYALSGVKPT